MILNSNYLPNIKGGNLVSFYTCKARNLFFVIFQPVFFYFGKQQFMTCKMMCDSISQGGTYGWLSIVLALRASVSPRGLVAHISRALPPLQLLVKGINCNAHRCCQLIFKGFYACALWNCLKGDEMRVQHRGINSSRSPGAQSAREVTNGEKAV